MKKLGVIAVLMSIVLAGCAHSTMRASVAMKISETEAHVCMGEGDTKVGDKVALYHSACPSKVGKDTGLGTCKKEYRGEGIVTKILNEHYSVVEFKAGTKFSEGSFIEKL